MPTAFRTAAILPDPSGRFRASILLASRLYGEWGDAAIAQQIARSALPMKALTLTPAEYDAMEADPALRCGYVDAPGDLESPFVPGEWKSL